MICAGWQNETQLLNFNHSAPAAESDLIRSQKPQRFINAAEDNFGLYDSSETDVAEIDIS